MEPFIPIMMWVNEYDDQDTGAVSCISEQAYSPITKEFSMASLTASQKADLKAKLPQTTFTAQEEAAIADLSAKFNFPAVLKLLQDEINGAPITVIIADILAIFASPAPTP